MSLCLSPDPNRSLSILYPGPLCYGVTYADHSIYNAWRSHIMHSIERRMHKYWSDVDVLQLAITGSIILLPKKSACMFVCLICLIKLIKSHPCNQASLKHRGNLLARRRGRIMLWRCPLSESPDSLDIPVNLSVAYASLCVSRWSSASPREGFWSVPGFVPRRSTTWCWAAGRGSPSNAWTLRIFRRCSSPWWRRHLCIWIY